MYTGNFVTNIYIKKSINGYVEYILEFSGKKNIKIWFEAFGYTVLLVPENSKYYNGI